MQTATQIAQPSRSLRKKQRTKDQLLTTMQQLVLTHGYEKTLISELTEQADVAMGTFYNYYESKTEIMDDVFDLVSQSYHLEIDELTCNLEDPALIVAASLRYSLQRVRSASELGMLLFDSGISSDRYTRSIYARGLADVISGLESQRFQASSPEVTASMVFGGCMAVAQGLYFQMLSEGAITAAVENALRMFGLENSEAREISKIELQWPESFELPLSYSSVIERTRQSESPHCFVNAYESFNNEVTI